MTESEAIETLIGIRLVSGYSKSREEALDMAIAALEKQEGKKPITVETNIYAADVRPVVRAAWQSLEQDKPPCKWYSCDYCGFHSLSKSNFCPNCGADMREES